MGECICIVRIKSDVSQLAILEMLVVRFSIIVCIYIYILATRIIIIYNYMYTINVSIIMQWRFCKMLCEQSPRWLYIHILYNVNWHIDRFIQVQISRRCILKKMHFLSGESNKF